METGEERTSTAIPAAAVTKSACGTTSSRKERQQQEVAFDAAMMGCNESLDNGGEGSTAGRDGRHDDGREMVDHDDDVMSEAEEEEKRASAGGDERRTGKGAGSGAKGVVSVNRETGIPDAGSDNISGNDRSLTTGGSLTLSLLILVLAGILLIICFLLRIRDMRREKRGGGIRGGNETKVISLQRSQHDSNIYFDKSPVTPMSDADVDDPDISLFDKSAFTDKS